MYRLISSLIVVLVFASASAQGKKERTSSSVKKEQAEVSKQIVSTQRNIESKTLEIQNKLNKLNSLNTSIALTTKKIESTNAAIKINTAKIEAISDSISKIEAKTKLLKDESAKSLIDARKRRKSMSEMALIFSSESFQQAMKRQTYIKQLNRLAAKRADQLKALQKRLEDNKKALDKLNQQQADLIASLEKENQNLALQKEELNSIISDLESQKAGLMAVLADQRSKAKRLDDELNRLIAEEMRRAEEERRRAEERRIAEQKRREKEAQERRLAEQRRLEEDKLLADNGKDKQDNKKNKDKNKKNDKKNDKNKDKNVAVNNVPNAPAPPTNRLDTKPRQNITPTETFAANKGRLTFPVDGKHKVVSAFGVHGHENLQYVKTENTGIDIEAARGSNAIAAFDGIVSSIFLIDGYHNVVMVRHGDYLTVYANLDQLHVKRGDTVKQGQSLGRIYSDRTDGGRTILHFEVRKETQKLNPAEWVGR